MTMSIKVLNSALDESPLRGGTIILRGVMENDSLKSLRTDDYQREVIPISSGHRLITAMKKGEPFPDIELGVRGENFQERNDVVFIHNDVYIIDGLQRVSAAIRFASLFPGLPQPRLGATIHFNTTREWERERFDVLNTAGVRVSPNILIRNQRENSPAIALLYDISEEDTRFALHKRVSWKQNMARTDLVTAMMLCRVTSALHSHIPGTSSRASVAPREMIPQMDRIVATVTPQHMKMNLRTFFDIIDECWGIKPIQYKDKASQLKGTFLITLSRIFSNHEDFWQMSDRKLTVTPEVKKKLASFPLGDPTVQNLASAGGKAAHILYGMLRDHLDKGKVKHRLRARSDGPEIDIAAE
jgi:hypothetical protein